MDSQEQKAKSGCSEGEQHREVGQSGQGPVLAKIIGPKRASGKSSPHCPVPGQDPTPHSSDPTIREMILEFSTPERITHWA